MAKELMEIGGFITEGAEIVNHDNSLSGNGTVDSPLGVMPGYNETVLFETTALNVSAVSLSEPLSSFERFRLYPYQAGAGYYNYGEFDYDDVRNVATGNNIRLLYSRGIGGNNPFQFLYGDYTLSNDTKGITATTGVRRWFPASTAAGGSDSNPTYIRKIVGINRIANN